MKRYYVFRHGYNTANNPSRHGGPATVRVATVNAADNSEAVSLAVHAGVTCYNGQHLYAEDADEFDRDRADKLSRVQLETVDL